MKRYQEDPSTPAHLRKLLESARGDDLDAGRRQRVAMRMGIAATGALTPDGTGSGTLAVHARAPFVRVTLHTLAIVGAGLGLAAAVATSSSSSSVATSSVPPSSHAPPPAEPVPAAVPPPPRLPSPAADPPSAAPDLVPAMQVAALPNAKPEASTSPSRPVPAQKVVATAPTEVGDAEDLRAELLALDAIRAATNEGRPRVALSLLDAYASKHRAGKLREEATVLRIEALAASGERAAATNLADRFLRASPNTVYAARVRAAVSRPSESEQP